MKNTPLNHLTNEENKKDKQNPKNLSQAKHASSATERSRGQKYKKIIKIGAVVLGVILIILVGLGYFSINPALSAYYSAQRGKTDLQQAQKALQEMKLSGAIKAIEYAEEDLNNANESLAKLKWVKIIPFVNIQYKAATQLATASSQISSSLKMVLQVAEDVTAPIEFKNLSKIGGLTPEQKEEVLKNLYQSYPRLELAQSEIELAELEINKMPSFGVVKEIEEAKNEVTSYLPQLKQVLEKTTVLSKLLPRFAGYPNEQTYLILLQNNTELRPTGGFLGSYGILKVKGGEIAELKTDDTYNLDNHAETNFTPPWQLPTLVHPDLNTWYLRDANWSPDFPTSAEKADWLYHQEGGKVEFNGSIAITSTFIEYLLEVTGPITVEGFPREFTSENVTELIQYHVEKRYAELGLSDEFRKNLIGELASKMIDKLFSLPKEKLTLLLDNLSKSLEEKHFMLYSKDEEIQNFIEEENWGAKIKEYDGDYLEVVDANMASLKTDAYVERKYNYELDLNGNDKVKAKLAITHRNNAPGFSWKTTRYRTWNRIYVPQGSELINIDGNEKGQQYYNEPGKTYEIIDEAGKTSIGTFTSIEPGEERTLTYEYYLPEKLSQDLKQNGYKLLFQKQPGTISPELEINVNSSNTIKSFSPQDIGSLLSNNKRVEYKTNLLTDKEFIVNF